MARNHSAMVAVVPPWSRVSVRAASKGAAWIPWARAWVWVLLWALLASKVEPSMRDVQRPAGVVTSSGKKGDIPDTSSARGNRPRIPVLHLNLGEVTIDRPARLPSSRTGTSWIKENSHSSFVSAARGGKRSAEDNGSRELSHDLPEQDIRSPVSPDPTAAYPSPTEQPSLADTGSCLSCPDGTPARVGAEPENGRTRPWGPWLSNQRRSPDADKDGCRHMGVVLLEPSVLDLGASQLCIPSSAEVTVRNVGRDSCSGQTRLEVGFAASTPEGDSGVAQGGVGDKEEEGGDPETLQLLSITSDSPEFHPSSFRPQILPSHGQTSFQVVFLPRSIGDTNAVLTVATSLGDVTYRVQARGVANPYKIQPVVESRISVGSTYTHPIMMFNPRDSPTLTIMEIYTTEGFLHLTMPEKPEQGTPTRRGSGKCSWCRGSDSSAFRDPGGGSELPGTLVESAGLSRPAWRIPPGVEFEIIRLSFLAEIPGNFQGFVHIHTDRDSLVVPVELHVSSGGVDPTPSEVDFGVLTTPSERRHASISLFNSGREPMLIIGARVSHPDPRINIGFREGTVIAPGMGMNDAVRLVYSGGEPAFDEEGRLADSSPVLGKVIIAVNHTLSDLSMVEINYRAHVLHGGVAYDWGQISFQVGLDKALSDPDSDWTGISETDPRNDNAKRKTSSSGDGAEEVSGWASNDAGVFRSRGEEIKYGISSLPPMETRLLDLKNHFPIPIELHSVTMEKCQDVFSLTMIDHSIDDDGKGFVALPQQSWTGVSLSFRRSIVEASGGLSGSYRYDGYEPGPPSLEVVDGDQSDSFEPMFPPSESEAVIGHPSGSERGVYGEGMREAIPSVSVDQRTPAQKALEEFQYSDGGDDSNDDLSEAGADRVRSSMSVSRTLPMGCVLRAETNASTHHIPVFVYDGSLHFNLLGEDGSFEDGSVPDPGVASSWGLSLASSAGLPQDSRFRFLTKRRGTKQSADFDSTRDDISGASILKEGSPSLTRPLTVHLGVVRAGTTVRRRFNVTNLNPVEVDISSNSFGQDESSFARMRFVGAEPLESALRSLLEIGKHVQARSDRSAASATLTPLPHQLVRERVVDGDVVERETRDGKGGVGSSVVCSLLPGAMAMFEVEARAPPSDTLDGAVRMEVRGLLLSTPAETVPVLVTYDAVKGGIFFHASPTSVATDGVTEEEVGPAVMHLNNAFPGREVISGVSIRSTASWEGYVEKIVSSGPLVRATLTQRYVPGVSMNGGVVEVGRVKYDASNSDCIGLDSWSCLAKRAETAVARDGDLWVGGIKEANGGDGSLWGKEDRNLLSKTMLRLVDRCHDDVNLNGAPGSINEGTGASSFGSAVVFRCSSDNRVVSTRRGVDTRRLGCQSPREIDTGESSATLSVVREDLARVCKELWRILPEVISSGINRFREEVTVKTTLGSPVNLLSVLVSMTVPSLVVGIANDSDVAHAFSFGAGEKVSSPIAGAEALRFPVTHVGETSEIFLEIYNPAQVPVRVQLVAVDEALSKRGDCSRSSPNSVFSGMADYAPVILSSGGSAVVGPVQFSPDEEGVFSVHVFLRNNLTRLEPVLLEAESGRGKLSIHPLEQATTATAQTEQVSMGGTIDTMLIGSEMLAGRPGVGVVGGGSYEFGGVSDVVQFPVDFRSWVRDPPTTEPVVKRWVVSNRGSMPLVIHGLGIRGGWREFEAIGHGVIAGWLGRWVGESGGGRRESCVFRLWRWVLSCIALDRRATSPTGRSCGETAAAVTSPLRCSDGGFRVVVVENGIGDGKRKNTCNGRWLPLTLQPGMEMEVAVDYTAAHCDPVNRSLDVVSSGGNASIQIVASAYGGPSAVAACRSAKRAALAAAAGRVKPKPKSKAEGEMHGEMEAVPKAGDGARKGSDDATSGRVEDRWGRAVLLVKMTFLMSALYFAFVVLRPPEGDLSPLAGWARRLQARVAGCISAGSSGSAGGFAVSVEVHASAAVVVSSPTVPASSLPAVSATPPIGNPRSPLWSPDKALTMPASPVGSHHPWDASSNKVNNGISCSSQSNVKLPKGPERESRKDIPSQCVRQKRDEGGTGQDCGSSVEAAAAVTIRDDVAKSVENGVSSGVAGSAVDTNTASEAGVPAKIGMESTGKGESLSVKKNIGTKGDGGTSPAFVTAVENLKSPGQDRRPNQQRQFARSPPGSDKGDGRSSISSSPTGGVVRQKAAAGVAQRNNADQQTPRSQVRGVTVKGSQAAGGSNGKRGGISGSGSGGSPLQHRHQRTNSGVSPIVAGGNTVGSRPPRGSNGSKARVTGSQQVRSNHSKGAVLEQRGQGSFRSSQVRTVSNGRSSANSTGAMMEVAVEFPNPAALASPGASINSADIPNHRNQRVQQQKQRQQDSGVSVVGGRRCTSPGYRETNVDSSVPTVSSSASPEFIQQQQQQLSSGGAGSYGWGLHYSNGQVPAVSSSYPNSNSGDLLTPAEPVQRTYNDTSGHFVAIGKDPFNGLSGGDGHVSPPLAPIGSNRLRAKSGGLGTLGPTPGPVGSATRAPPGLSPAPNPANSYRPHFSAAPASPVVVSPVVPVATPAPAAFSGFSSSEDAADWSDNLDAFATASAVVAGVLSAEDMDDPTVSFSFGRDGPARLQDGLGLAGGGGRRRVSSGSRLGFYMSASGGIKGGSGAIGGGDNSTRLSTEEAPSFGITEEDQRLLFGSTDGSGVLSFMDEGDDD